ncbi:hypothetical protein [Thermosipho ferrireducens]|nr:hypothetical protein [Thermosipho ferrireducens]
MLGIRFVLSVIKKMLKAGKVKVVLEVLKSSQESMNDFWVIR